MGIDNLNFGLPRIVFIEEGLKYFKVHWFSEFIELADKVNVVTEKNCCYCHLSFIFYLCGRQSIALFIIRFRFFLHIDNYVSTFKEQGCDITIFAKEIARCPMLNIE